MHPAFVNLESRGQLGWLDGFNEWLCRCGLAFNGPPGADEDGTPITLTESAIRNLVRIIDFLPFFYTIGVVTMFIE